MVTDGECSPSSDYTMRLRPGLAIDGEKMANDARYINDYRGIGEVPASNEPTSCERAVLFRTALRATDPLTRSGPASSCVMP